MLSPSDVFDQPQPQVGNKKIEFHISTDMPAAVKKDLEKEDDFEEQNPGKHVLVLFFSNKEYKGMLFIFLLSLLVNTVI